MYFLLFIKVNVKECEETGKLSADLKHKFKHFSECRMPLTESQVPGKKGWGPVTCGQNACHFFPLHASCYINHFLINMLAKRANHLKKRQFDFFICGQNSCQSNYQLAFSYIVVLPNNNN